MEDLDLKQESQEEKEKEKKETTPKKEKEEKEKVYKDFFLYFIDAHSTETSVKIQCLENEHTQDLEKVKDTSVEMPDEKKVYYTIYKLKVTPTSGMESLKIKFNLADEGKNFQAKIELTKFSHDIFFYDFIYSRQEGSEKEKIKIGEILSHLDQFRIYLNYLEDLKKEKDSPEIEDLALSTRKILFIKAKKDVKGKEVKKYHDLSLYFMVFAACYKSPIISKILSDFYLDRVDKKYCKDLSEKEKT